MRKVNGFSVREIVRNIGAKSIAASLLVFLLTVAATCVGAYSLYNSTKESIELQGRVSAVQASKDYDGYLLVRKNTVMLAGHVVDEMIREKKPASEILEYLTAESLSIKRSIDMDYTGLYGWINGEYCDGVGWVPDKDYVPTERPWYTETVADDSDVTFVKPYLDDQTGTILTTMAEQLSDGVSVIALDVTLSRIQEIAEEIARQTPDSQGLVLDKTGQVIAHSNKDELGKNYEEETGTLGAALAEHLHAADHSQFNLNFEGQQYVVFVEPIEGGWQAISLINTDVFYRPLRIILPLVGLFTLLEAFVFVSVIFGQSERSLAIASAREAQTANLAKTQFLSHMSHELRTPLNAIIGLDTIMLRDESIPSNARDSFKKIDTSAQHLLSLINDILDASNIESGRLALKEERFSLRKLLAQVNTIVSDQCDNKRLNFEFRETGNLDEYYVGDELRLRQVLVNILDNSVKFTNPPGTVTFVVTQESVTEERAELRFMMKDTGIGMDEEFIPTLFEAFSQEDDNNTSRYGGSGLGMAITKSIVEMMDGSIEVTSAKGSGTTFVVTVMLRRTQQPVIPTGITAPAAPTTEPSGEAIGEPSAEAPSLAGRHVLICEDQEINAEVLIELLSLEDITAEWTENGQLGVETFADSEAGHFDAILMDMRMPIMDGLAATRAIRKLNHPDAATIPIVALTANAFEEDVQNCLQAGMDAHLPKPVDFDLLLQTLARLIESR